MTPERPIALDAYETLAEAFAAKVDTKPHNAFYERPATLSLLPDVSGRRVLDAGCGPGAYSAWLLEHGATVTGFDVSPRMVELAHQRTGGRADLWVGDLAAPLSRVADASIDVVLCPLTLEYVRDWHAPLREFRRVLVPGGIVVVSVTHPFFDATYFRSTDYFATELVHAEWRGFGPHVRMPSFRRSLHDTLGPFCDIGFHITGVVEPRPTEAFRRADPRHYEELRQKPCFLCIRAVVPAGP